MARDSWVRGRGELSRNFLKKLCLLVVMVVKRLDAIETKIKKASQVRRGKESLGILLKTCLLSIVVISTCSSQSFFPEVRVLLIFLFTVL